MAKFTVIGVERESEMDTQLEIEAATAANAKAKAELRDVIVTEVIGPADQSIANPPAPSSPQEVQVVHSGNTAKIIGSLAAIGGVVLTCAGVGGDGSGIVIGAVVFGVGIIVFSIGRFFE